MTAQTLRSRSLKDLADMARKRGVNGWHSMRKDQLVKALVQSANKRAPTPKLNGKKNDASKSIRFAEIERCDASSY